MFTIPSLRNPITNYTELLNLSYRLPYYTLKRMVMRQKNDKIVYCNEYGIMYMTPFRFEVIDILKNKGFRIDNSLFVPTFNSLHYSWLALIANKENWAKTYEMAFQVSTRKKIRPVTITQNVTIKELINDIYRDTYYVYSPLATMFLTGSSMKNIGTYIVVNSNTLVICDEYARTFIVKSNNFINSIVTTLVQAGYTRTLYPENYVTVHNNY